MLQALQEHQEWQDVLYCNTYISQIRSFVLFIPHWFSSLTTAHKICYYKAKPKTDTAKEEELL